MLLEILKALGFDVQAHVTALKADLDQRVEATTSQVSQVAQQAAVLAFLYAFAAGAALLAVVVALFALFWWVSDTYGVYAGLGAVFVILVVAAAIAALMARGRSKALAINAAKAPRALFGPTGAGAAAAPVASSPPAASPAAQNPTAGDLVEPLAALLTATQGRGSVAAGLLAGVDSGTVNRALDRAANVIRSGDRANLLVVLGGAAVLGFLFARGRSRRG
jgi:hypothetical protein